MKRYHCHQGKDIFVTAGTARDLAPGAFGILAIGGGAEGWSVAHRGPGGDVVDLGGDYYFATPEEALEFVKELIALMQGGEPPAEG